jgi:CubicO group peptidase (beta-lactamase class C family)
MHDTLRRHVESRRLPGLVAVISRRGADHVDAIGTLAFDRTAAMRPDTISRLASVTKPVTAVAAMILVEECKLRLDDPVDEFLPSWRIERYCERSTASSTTRYPRSGQSRCAT